MKKLIDEEMNHQNFETHLKGTIKDFQYLISKTKHKTGTIVSNQSLNTISTVTELVKTNITYIKNVISLVESIIKLNPGNKNTELNRVIQEFESCLQLTPSTNTTTNCVNEVIVIPKKEKPETSKTASNKFNLSLNRRNGSDSEETVDGEIPFYLLPGLPRTNIVLTEKLKGPSPKNEKVEDAYDAATIPFLSDDDDKSTNTREGIPNNSRHGTGNTLECVDEYISDSDATICDIQHELELLEQVKSTEDPSINDNKNDINENKPLVKYVDIELNSSIDNVISICESGSADNVSSDSVVGETNEKTNNEPQQSTLDAPVQESQEEVQAGSVLDKPKTANSNITDSVENKQAEDISKNETAAHSKEKTDYLSTFNLVPVSSPESDENSNSLLTLVREEIIENCDEIGKEDYGRDIPKMYQEIMDLTSSDFSDTTDSSSVDEATSSGNLSESSDHDSPTSNVFKIKPLSINLTDCIKYKKYFKKIEEERRLDKAMDRINRLCDLKSLECRPSKKSYNKKIIKKTKPKSLILETSSSSDSDDEHSSHSEKMSHTLNESFELEADYNKRLLETISSVIDDTDDSSSSDSSEQDEKKTDKPKKLKRSHQSAKRQLTEEEKKKSAWRNDPLLKRNFFNTIYSDSDSSQERQKDCKRSRVDCEVKPDDLKLLPKNDSSADKILLLSDDEDFLESSETPLELDSDSSSADSDRTVVLGVGEEDERQSVADTTISSDKCIEISDDEESVSSQSSSPNKKGRKNIRGLIGKRELEMATQKANREEELRKKRLAEIEKTRESLSQNLAPDVEVSQFILDPTSDPKIVVNQLLADRLKPHQKKGVLFMWQACYESVEHLQEHPGSGCILAHCMGLGKTFQVITLIHTLFSYPVTNTRKVLIVCPLSIVQNWRNEFSISMEKLHPLPFDLYKISNPKDPKLGIIHRWGRNGGVLIMGYDTFSSIVHKGLSELSEADAKAVSEALLDPGPDLVVCDEAHLMQNTNTKRNRSLNKVKTKRRITLTGTPLQNNLLEYYHMVEFVKPSLLGTTKEFKRNFEEPIKNGQYHDSTAKDIRLMKQRTHCLHKILCKTVQRFETNELEKYLPKITDYAIFMKLSPLQIKLYVAYMKYVEIRRGAGIGAAMGFLNDNAMLRLVSSHPYILILHDNKKDVAKKKKVKDKTITEKTSDLSNVSTEKWWEGLLPPDVQNNVNHGCKLVAIKHILEETEEICDKVLIFSHSLSEMDCIEHFLKTVGTTKCPNWSVGRDYLRMDGSCPTHLRSNYCTAFNSPQNPKLRMFLLSFEVGGLGLNLTAANRVIILGADFNPSYDTQSIYRAYRFGQCKEVFVYRIVAMGTMEEKNYHRSVTKQATALRVVDEKQITRHYKSLELQEMYKYDFDYSNNAILAPPADQLLAKVLLKIQDLVYKYHDHLALLKNIPNEELTEQECKAAWEEFSKLNEPPPPQPPVPPVTLLPQMTQPGVDPYFFIDTNPMQSKPIDKIRLSKNGSQYQITSVPSTSQSTFPVYLPSLPRFIRHTKTVKKIAPTPQVNRTQPVNNINQIPANIARDPLDLSTNRQMNGNVFPTALSAQLRLNGVELIPETVDKTNNNRNDDVIMVD